MSLFSKKMRMRSVGQRGFSLTEMIVTLGIMTVILTIVVLNQRSYTDGASLANLADNIGITLSQAQAYGIAVRELSPGSAEFNVAYGITVSILGSGSNSAFLFFADRNNNEYYDGAWSCVTGGTSECLQRTDFTGGNYIDQMCILRSPGGDLCGNTNVSRMDITFLRPNAEARIKFFNNGGEEFSPANIIGGRIFLRSPGGLTKTISVYHTGQISIQ